MLWCDSPCEFTLLAISCRLASLAPLTTLQAHWYSVRAHYCWLPLSGCVLCASTRIAARLFTSHFRQLRTDDHRPSCDVRRVCSIVGSVLAVCFTTCFASSTVGSGSGSGSSSLAGSTQRRLGRRICFARQPPLPVVRAASPFGALVAVLHDMNVKGTDDPAFPLPQDVLDAMVVEPKLVRLANFLQDHFKFGDSNETLSDQDARSLAYIAATRLSIGAFLLQPSTLGQFSSSQMDGVSWPTFAFLRCGCPSGTALSPRLCRCGGAPVACCWCHCTRSPHLRGSAVHITRRLHECSVMHRVTCNICCFAICLISALLLVHGRVTCRGRSRGRCRSSCWYVESPSSHQLAHFVHLLCSVCRISHTVRSFQPRSANTCQCVVVW